MANSNVEADRSLRASWGSLSDYREVLFGIAIIGIVVFHLYESTMRDTLVHSALGLFARFSAGVDAFLFLSSMGLYFAFSKNGNLGRFYKRRVLRILPTFLVVAIPFYALQDFVQFEDGSRFLPDLFNISFLTEGYRQFWYIYAIIIFYLFYPLLHRFIDGSDRSFMRMCVVIGCDVAITVALGVFNEDFLSNTELMLTRFPAFVAGIYAGKLVKMRAPMRGRYVLCLVAVALLLWCMSLTPLTQFGGANLARRYFYTCTAVLLCMLVPVILKAFECAADQKALAFFGRISLEMYIVNVASRSLVVWYAGEYFFSGRSNWVQVEYCIVEVLLTIAGAYVLHKAMQPVNSWLMRLADKADKKPQIGPGSVR